jgi:nicotinamide mononucleotide transporter
MDLLLSFFDVNTTFFTVLNYPISYIEFFGTLLSLAYIWLATRRNIWNWPISILGAIIFGILFYQIQLYADMFEQVYYFITAFWGWYLWHNHKSKKDDKIIVETNKLSVNLLWLGGMIVGTVLLSFILANINLWLPALFTQPASLVVLDSATTIMSFAATLLLLFRKLESWILWIIVDVIAIGLYWYKDVPFLSLLYVVFLVLAIIGFFNWLKAYKTKAAL